MRYPNLSEEPRQRFLINEFRGLNCMDRILENEFCAMQNMSSDRYPVLSTRALRMSTEKDAEYEVLAMTVRGDVFAEVVYKKAAGVEFLYINGEEAVNLNEFQTSGSQNLVFMGNYVIVGSSNPIRVCLDKVDGKYHAEPLALEKKFLSLSDSCTLWPSNEEDLLGDYYEGYGNPDELLVGFSEGDRWCNYADGERYVFRSGRWKKESFPVYLPNNYKEIGISPVPGDYIRVLNNHRYLLDKYNGKSWTPVPYSKVKLLWKDVTFSKGDSLTINVLDDEGNIRNDEETVRTVVYKASKGDIKGETVEGAEGLAVQRRAYIQIDDCIPFLFKGSALPYLYLFRLAREIPEMDFLCEHNNRLWGVSHKGNEVYASKLGDPANWNVFTGLSTDSYAVTVGTQGDFTGICAYQDSVYFLKEHVIHKISGTKPANFQLYTVPQKGVQFGGSRSLVEIDGLLYYKAIDGVCVFDGYNRTVISKPIAAFLENKESSETGALFSVAAGIRGKYYYLVSDNGDDQSRGLLFVYDTRQDLWHLEGSVFNFCVAQSYRNTVVFSEDGGVSSVFSEQLFPGTFRGAFSKENPAALTWHAETGPIYCDILEKKYVQKLQVRFWISETENAKFCLAVNYDESGWDDVYTCTVPGEHTAVVTLQQRRSDRIRFKFYGTGECKIYAFVRDLVFGSDVR